MSCSHGGSNVDPDNRDVSPVLPIVKKVSEFIGKFIKGVAKHPSIHEPCVYTVSRLTCFNVFLYTINTINSGEQVQVLLFRDCAFSWHRLCGVLIIMGYFSTRLNI